MTRPLPNILKTIHNTKLAEVEALLARTSMAQLEQMASSRLQTDTPRPFEAAVSAGADIPHVIAEVKKASPSKGIIRADFAPQVIAGAYHRGGAAAISCLTDEAYFQGKLEYLQTVRAVATEPVLRKDFLVTPAQILEAVAAGADAVLLIARMLDTEDLTALYRLAKGFGLGVLMEVHDEPDLEKALDSGATLIGVNNRDLDTFVVDVETTYRLREKIPQEIPVVAESGIESHSQLQELAKANIAAVLVGEHLMRQADLERALTHLRTGT